MIGKTISHYKILEKLGEGGMGVVYKAEDTKLKRDVAIKFLPRQIATSEEERERFKIEAQAAAALNHPNIATIYNIDEVNGEMFIVMEYIDGWELKEIVGSQNLVPLPDVLDYATQIASGLDAAHKKGVIHRDIKSANIMITDEGLVKIMDFGLAKVRGGAQVTKVGTTLGTAAYMPPEQASGEEADQRSDMWSFGVVLYEMLSGQVPFKGDYEQAVIYAILNEEPEPLSAFRNETPKALQHLIDKALAKDLNDRYQSAKEMLIDLQQINKQLINKDFDLESEAQKSKPRARTRKPPIGQNSYRKRTTIGIGILIILVIATSIVWKQVFGPTKVAIPFQNMQMSRLTSTGKAAIANISPDGNYVVHTMTDQGKSSLWVRQIVTGSDVQIIPSDDVAYHSTVFSPDGNYIYYVMSNNVTPIPTLYRVPTLGGRADKILADIDSDVTFSPDGQQIAFIRQLSSQGEEALMVANINGSNVGKLTSRKEPGFFVSEGGISPSWSPDGGLIACGAGSVAGHWRMGVLIVKVEDGTQEWLLNPKIRFDIARIVWTPDGNGLVINAVDTTSLTHKQLWHLTYPNGDLRRITNDLNDYEGTSLGLTEDGGTLVTVKVEQISNIWTVPNLKTNEAIQLSSSIGTNEGVLGVSTAENGLIAYSSIESGNPDIWIIDHNGQNKRQLTTDPYSDLWPSLSMDGRHLIFQSDRTGTPHIWKMDLESGTETQLTKKEDYNPVFSHDGKWAVYWGYRSGEETGAAYFVWKVPIDSGESIPLTKKLARMPAISPDGKFIACLYQAEPSGPNHLAILNFAGGEPLKLFDIPQSPRLQLVWSGDSRAVLYIDLQGNVSNIWAQPIDGGQPQKLTEFKSGRIFTFDLSSDGRTIVAARGLLTSDVVLIRDF